MIMNHPAQNYFRSTSKPASFVEDPYHCEECREHNDVLRQHDADTISLSELGNPGWDPVCFISNIEGFRYYLPALIRLACGRGDEYYLDSFLFHLNTERTSQLSRSEREALATFLEDLMATMPKEIELNCDGDLLLERIIQLRP